MAWTREKINGIYKEIELRAARDKDFRDLLLSKSSEALKQVADEAIPVGVKINFIEKDPSYDATFVLPDLMSDEFSEKELEQISGGICGRDLCTGALISCSYDSTGFLDAK